MTKEAEKEKTSLEKTREKEALAKKSAAATLADLLKDPVNKKKIAESCARGLDPDKLVRVALTAMQKNPLLLQCTSGSVLKSLMDCASYGLMPNSHTNEAHLVPFRNNKQNCWECVLVPGYNGLTKMATNTGHVSHVTVREVYKNDHLEFEYGLNEKLVHRPANGEPGEFIGAYSIVRFKDGGNEFRVVLLEEGRAHRDRFSPAYKKNKGSPWNTDEPAMIMKTSLRKVLKYVPSSPESEKLAIAIARDERLESAGYEGLLEMENPEGEQKEEIPGPEPIDVDPDTGEVLSDEDRQRQESLRLDAELAAEDK